MQLDADDAILALDMVAEINSGDSVLILNDREWRLVAEALKMLARTVLVLEVGE